MKRNSKMPGTSMYHVVRKLNIESTKLLKRLRAFEILKGDNTPNIEYGNVGLFFNTSFVGKYRLIKTVPTLRANEDGINFIGKLILKNPKVFRPKKTG